MQWSPFNSYVTLVTSIGVYTVSKAEVSSGQMTWAIHACPLDTFGKPAPTWPRISGAYIGGYTAPANDDGEYIPDRPYIERIISDYEASVPIAVPEEPPAAPDIPPE